jgi:hypothetical protein
MPQQLRLSSLMSTSAQTEARHQAATPVHCWTRVIPHVWDDHMDIVSKDLKIGNGLLGVAMCRDLWKFMQPSA